MSSIFDLVGKYDNLHDPEPFLNKPSAVYGLTISFLVLAWACASARLYTRFVILRCPGWDDALVVAVLVMTLLMTIGTCRAVKYGLGQHFLLLTIPQIMDFVKSFYFPNCAYAMSTALIKLALCTQYLRVIGPRSPRLRLLTKFVIVVTALWGIAYSTIAWIPCWPVPAYWDWSVEAVARWGFGSHTVSVFVGTYVSHVASNVVLDLIVFAIPLPLYFDTTLTQKSKLGLCGLVFLGVVVNIFSTWRLALIIRNRAGTSPTLDPSWYGSEPIVLAALEVDLALICASLPVFWPVIEKHIGKIFVTYEVEVTREMTADDADETELSPVDKTAEPLSPPLARVPNSNRRSLILPGRWSLFPTTTVTRAEALPRTDSWHHPRDDRNVESHDDQKASSVVELLPV